jgi:hypothetical protein
MIDLLGYLQFLIESRSIVNVLLLCISFCLFLYTLIEVMEWGTIQIKNILDKMVAVIPEKEFMLTKMPQKYEQTKTGLVLYNTNTEKYLSVEEVWNGQDGYDSVYKWADSTSCLLIDKNGHRNSGFGWNNMVSFVGHEIHACLLVPVEIFVHDTMFGRHRGYFMNADFLHAFRFQDELYDSLHFHDDESSAILKLILDGLKKQ